MPTKPLDSELTPRGARTKAALLAAARTVFARDGFVHARVTDIAEEAGVAHGTFYTYFQDKTEIFHEVALGLAEEFQAPAPRERVPNETLFDAVLRANRHYYDTYTQRGPIMTVVEQVATFNDDLRALRREIRRGFVERSERAIRRWQAEGLADPLVDAHYAASALGSMVDRSIYVWLVLGEPHDPDMAIETLSRLWVNALGLSTDGHRPGPASRRARAAKTPARPAGPRRT
jgi:AcrR family transcriptional regulator